MSIFDNISADQYRNTDPYPERPKRPARPNEKATPDEFRRHADAIEQYATAYAQFEAAMAAWKKKEDALEAQFEIDLATEFGMLDHPKRARLYGKAYERGHSSGLSEIASIYEDLVELVK